MDHRRTVGRRAFVPPVWLIVLAIVAALVSIAALGWLAYATYLDDNDQTPRPAATEATPTPEPEPTQSPTPEPTPPPEPEPTTPPVDRSPGVSILNGTSISGLAATTADHLNELGWGDIRTGDTGGTYPENTVYFPPQFEQQAATLAADLGIERIRPSVSAMRGDRLTVVLVDQPSSVQ